jgi:gamma-glutamyltranspeptidase/glutathione hydrolase
VSEYAVATPQSDATAAAVAAFEAGGNAIDAALAAAAVLTVTYPHNCALGGDLFALVRLPGGETLSVNASGPAARAADADRQRRRGPLMPVAGPATVTVPGLVAGWERLHELGARLPWTRALAPAIGLAEDGAAVAPGLAAAIADSPGVAADPGMAAVLAPGGAPLRAGDLLRQPALAATLRRLAAHGAAEFYEGETAARLVAGLAARGGELTAADLREFTPETGPPLRGRFGDLDVLTSPPNSSGVLVLQALAALEASGAPDPLGADAGALAEILRLGGVDRDARLADPRASPFDERAWLGAERVEALAASARAAAAGRRGPMAATGDPRPLGDTVAVVTADGEGRAVSLIQSVFHSFGAQILEPATGVLLHNRGAFFSLEPGHPNRLAPGRRPAHTLMPIVVERGGALAGVLGTMGGKVHAQIHVQVLLRLLAGRTPQEAVDAPRWVVGGMDLGEPGDVIRVEDGCAGPARAALERARLRPEPVPRGSDWLGHAQAIWLGDGLRAGSDLRADGAAATGRWTPAGA